MSRSFGRMTEFQSIANRLQVCWLRAKLDAKFKFGSQPLQVIIRLSKFIDVTTLEVLQHPAKCTECWTLGHICRCLLRAAPHQFAVSGSCRTVVMPRTSRTSACTRWQLQVSIPLHQPSFVLHQPRRIDRDQLRFRGPRARVGAVKIERLAMLRQRGQHKSSSPFLPLVLSAHQWAFPN